MGAYQSIMTEFVFERVLAQDNEYQCGSACCGSVSHYAVSSLYLIVPHQCDMESNNSS
jgi:hypothetical protein